VKPRRKVKNRAIMKKLLALEVFALFFCGAAMAENSSEIFSTDSFARNASIQHNASNASESDSELPSWVYPSYPAYASKDKPDPFVSFVKVKEYETMQAARKSKKEKKALTPLENMDTNALKVVAIMNSDGNNLAMVELPDGKGFLIRPGMSVGLYDGIVKAIKNDMVVVEEEVVDVFGETKKREINLRLRQEKE